MNGNRQPDDNRVTVFRRGQYIEILPPVVELMERFETLLHRGRASQAVGFKIVPGTDSLVWPMTELFERSPRDYLQTFAGLEPYICRHLESTGHIVQFTGQRPAWLDEPQVIPAEHDPRRDQRLLKFINDTERGILRYRPDHVQVSWLIAQVRWPGPGNRSSWWRPEDTMPNSWRKISAGTPMACRW